MSSDNLFPYAVIASGGKQYTVKKGDKIRVELLSGEEGREMERGSEIKFSEVLFVQNGDTNLVGKPFVSGATVVGKILGTSKDDKAITYKKRRRRRYVRKVGHRQQKTDVLIEAVSY